MFKNNKIVMIVDDDMPTRFLLSEVLRKPNVSVVEFENGIDAINFFRVHKEDIILALIDIKLPDIEGYEVLSIMRQLKPEMPAISISAFYTPEKSDHDGFNAFVSKPIALSKMADLVSNMVSAN